MINKTVDKGAAYGVRDIESTCFSNNPAAIVTKLPLQESPDEKHMCIIGNRKKRTQISHLGTITGEITN